MGTDDTAIGVSHSRVPTRVIDGEYEKDIYISDICGKCGCSGALMRPTH